MYPHERSLVQKMEGKPFALIGVNTDPNRDTAKNAVISEKLTWRSFYDQSTSGPIDSAWHVNSWPTIYVIDDRGVIRFKNVRGDDLDRAVEQLLKEMGE